MPISSMCLKIRYRAASVVCWKGLERTVSASPTFSGTARLRYVHLSMSALLDDAVVVVPAKVTDS